MASALALSLLVGGVASASPEMMGFGLGFTKNADPATVGQQFDERMARDAGVLGISVTEMKTAWAQGKNLMEVAKEKGISETTIQEKMKAQRVAEMKEHLQILVGQGKITQAQADARLKYMSEHAGKKMGMGKGKLGCDQHGLGQVKGNNK